MKNKAFILLALCALLFVQAKAQELLNYPLDTVNGEEVYRYQVEKSIGLYRVGVNFNVSQSDIVRLNPQLRERGLHFGETLLIPTKRPVVISTKPRIVQTIIKETRVMPEQEPKDTVISVSRDTVIAQDTLITPDTIVPDTRRVVELALMLPFESHQTKRSGNAERMMEVYQGALLALRDLHNDSTLYRLRVYDSERSERRVQALCDSTELDHVQGIVGLVYPIQIARMATWCTAHQVPLLLPFSDDIDLANQPQVLQFNSTDEQEADSLCAWLKQKGDNVHCVLVEVRDADLSGSIRTLRKRMNAHQIAYTALPLRDLLNDSAAYALDIEKENVIILHSDRYQQARIVLPHIESLRNVGHNVRIVSQYAWQKEHIDLPQVYTSVFTANTDPEAYNALWKETYVNEHVSESPRYDLLGYDLIRAMVAWLNGEKEMKGLQSDIRWIQVNNGGWQNACVQVKSEK